MIISHDPATDKYVIECESCGARWLIEGYEISVEPWPHFICSCKNWIAVF